MPSSAWWPNSTLGSGFKREIAWYMLFAVLRVVHFTVLPPEPDNHSSHDVSIVLKQLQSSLHLTGIDVRIQLDRVRGSVDRGKFNRDIRKRQRLFDPVRELVPRMVRD